MTASTLPSPGTLGRLASQVDLTVVSETRGSQTSTLQSEARWNPWLASVTHRLETLARKEPYADLAAVGNCLRWLGHLPGGLPKPFIALGDDGSAGAEWDVGQAHFYITFYSTGVEAYFVSGSQEWEIEAWDMGKVASALANIAAAVDG